MKTRLFSLVFLCFFNFCMYGQTADKLAIKNDSYNVNEAPSQLYNLGLVMKADRKDGVSIGLPSNIGTSSTLTFVPWWDGGGGSISQLSMNWDGIYYRINTHGENTWNGWKKVIMSESDGNIVFGGWKDNVGLGPQLVFQGVRTGSDAMYIAKYVENNKSQLRVNIGLNKLSNEQLSIGSQYWQDNQWHSSMVVTGAGKVGIGVDNPQNKLDVNGTIRAKEVRVESGWADFVFKPDYKLLPLEEVKAHIEEHKHLPGIPSETEVKENGVALSDMTTKMMQKIEELTLYVIQQNEKASEQQQIINQLRDELNELKNNQK